MKILLYTLLIIIFAGCSTKQYIPQQNTKMEVGYLVQVGSFKNPNNAWRFVDKLNKNGLEAFLFNDNGFYKVRFGNYRSINEATKEAQRYKKRGYFKDFFIINPTKMIANKKHSTSELREELKKSTYGYIGVPYKWGGTSESGFDCSGLTYTVYRLNGIDIPRNSLLQFNSGKKVQRNNLQIGDLVFFSINKKRVDHVGVYVGDNKFIHAPSKGKKVQVAKLDSQFWSSRYKGARDYTK
ncbi:MULTISPECIES: NlpC/P60 family protein [Helicobacter]|uniref:NlpC/P60 family protein n=1 Tax=Helicobacter ibis TaxID=2962633 RepID=A0ABT4VF45_9HELI|nr:MULTISPECIES: NlpC/P60 family protein [Helicobacter]MDA3967187.1 NlpC/P60 family protein [Helicobacter sp. WB40]MDA3969314.1 NlpC/P60 family protein [Helicobacter ibis]